MRTHIQALCAAAALVLCLLWGVSVQAQVQVQRFALIIGANDGGQERVRLKFAATDAQSFTRVLDELGGVPQDNRLVVLDPDMNGLQKAFQQMAAMLAQASDQPTRVELLMYYSGHSDEGGLLLGEERLDYKTLRQMLEALPADVRIAILDSCASGAMTRIKGGQRQPPFMIDAASEVKGHAYLTSSSADEVAQESDALGGSFFTHYLVSGLRGAADLNSDGRVTLNEAYQFAFNETLARTENTRSGAQHPAYDIQLSGTGDLVLTDLRGTSARLVIDGGVSGRMFIRDQQGVLVVELFKQPGRVVELGLEPGEYGVTVKEEDRLRQATVILTDNHMATLTTGELESVTMEANVARGAGPGVEAPLEDLSGYRHVPLKLSLLPSLEYPFQGHGQKEIVHASLNLGMAMFDRLEGVQIGAGVNWIREDTRGPQIVGGLNIVENNMRGAQIAGGANLVLNDARGPQIAGGFNYVEGTSKGVQVGGGANLVMGDVRGVQIAGGFNYSNDMKGSQISTVNIARDMAGLQIGLVNVGRRVKGTQIGLVNVAQSVDGASIGLLNIVEEGQLHLDIWGSDILPLQAGVRFGGKHFYTILTGGIRAPETNNANDTDTDTAKDEELIWFFGGGLGGNFPLRGKWGMDIDAIAGQLRLGSKNDHTNTFYRMRVGVNWRLYDHLAFFGGLSANFLVADQLDRARFPFGPQLGGSDEDGVIFFGGSGPERSGTTLSIWPGAFIGIRI